MCRMAVVILFSIDFSIHRFLFSCLIKFNFFLCEICSDLMFLIAVFNLKVFHEE